MIKEGVYLFKDVTDETEAILAGVNRLNEEYDVSIAYDDDGLTEMPMRAQWTEVAEDDLRSLHGIDVMKEVGLSLTQEVIHEVAELAESRDNKVSLYSIEVIKDDQSLNYKLKFK